MMALSSLETPSDASLLRVGPTKPTNDSRVIALLDVSLEVGGMSLRVVDDSHNAMVPILELNISEVGHLRLPAVRRGCIRSHMYACTRLHNAMPHVAPRSCLVALRS